MTRSVYLIDNEDSIRASLEALRPDFIVHSFSNSDAFLADAPLLGQGVVLLDPHNSETGSINILRRIRAEGPGRFAAIVITADGSLAFAVQAMKAGVSDFIEKPCNADLLLKTIDDAFTHLLEEDAAGANARAAQDRIAALSPRERDVLAGLIEGLGNKVIAHQLAISPRTVEIYRAILMTRLGVRSLPEVLRVAFIAGFIPPP